MQKDDEIRLRHMLDAARQALDFVREDLPPLVAELEKVLRPEWSC